VFENRVLKRDEVMGEWRKLHNEELRDVYSSPSIIRLFKSRRMRWARHVARMGDKRNVYYLWESRGKETTKDQDIGGWIILGRILERLDGVMWTGLVWLRLGTGGEFL
jgi:hypothetical protein